MAGVIFFNPIFGRSSIPTIAKIGLSLGIALNVTYGLTGVYVADYTTIDLLVSVVREFAVGFAIGFIMQLFLAIFHIGGELMDLQLGFSMAQMYDPSTNSQISVTGNVITIMYTLLFFITNSHLSLLAIASKSYSVVPVGLGGVSNKIGLYIIELFGYILVYAVQLSASDHRYRDPRRSGGGHPDEGRTEYQCIRGKHAGQTDGRPHRTFDSHSGTGAISGSDELHHAGPDGNRTHVFYIKGW